MPAVLKSRSARSAALRKFGGDLPGIAGRRQRQEQRDADGAGAERLAGDRRVLPRAPARRAEAAAHRIAPASERQRAEEDNAVAATRSALRRLPERTKCRRDKNFSLARPSSTLTMRQIIRRIPNAVKTT